jgi:hypothetical protein
MLVQNSLMAGLGKASVSTSMSLLVPGMCWSMRFLARMASSMPGYLSLRCLLANWNLLVLRVVMQLALPFIIVGGILFIDSSCAMITIQSSTCIVPEVVMISASIVD